MAHTEVKQVRNRATSACSTVNLVKRADWEIGKEDLGVHTWFSPDVFRDVPDCEIYGIDGFPAKRSDLSFIGGKEDGDDGCARCQFLNCLL